MVNSIRVQLGKAQRIFNPMDDYHIFEFIDKFETVVYAYLEVYNHKNRHRLNIKTRKNLGVACDLTLGHYHSSKDPPEMIYT